MENFCSVVFQQIFEKWEIKSDWENEIISEKKKKFLLTSFQRQQKNLKLKIFQLFWKKKKNSFVNIKRKFLNINKACQNIDIPTKTVS